MNTVQTAHKLCTAISDGAAAMSNTAPFSGVSPFYRCPIAKPALSPSETSPEDKHGVMALTTEQTFAFFGELIVRNWTIKARKLSLRGRRFWRRF